MDQVAPISAPRIEHPHSVADIPAKDLVEYIDVDLAKLFLEGWWHGVKIRRDDFL